MYGKLLAFLRDHRTRQHYYNFSEDSDALTSRDLTIFAYCVARGMEYLGSKGVRKLEVTMLRWRIHLEVIILNINQSRRVLTRVLSIS